MGMSHAKPLEFVEKVNELEFSHAEAPSRCRGNLMSREHGAVV